LEDEDKITLREEVRNLILTELTTQSSTK